MDGRRNACHVFIMHPFVGGGGGLAVVSISLFLYYSVISVTVRMIMCPFAILHLCFTFSCRRACNSETFPLIFFLCARYWLLLELAAKLLKLLRSILY